MKLKSINSYIYTKVSCRLKSCFFRKIVLLSIASLLLTILLAVPASLIISYQLLFTYSRTNQQEQGTLLLILVGLISTPKCSTLYGYLDRGDSFFWLKSSMQNLRTPSRNDSKPYQSIDSIVFRKWHVLNKGVRFVS